MKKLILCGWFLIIAVVVLILLPKKQKTPQSIPPAPVPILTPTQVPIVREKPDPYGEYNYWTCAYDFEGEKTSGDYFYNNDKLGFSITMPQDWFVPSFNNTDPHFYNCQRGNNTGPSFELQGGTTAQDREGLFDMAYEEYQNGLVKNSIQIYSNLIPNAIVFRQDPEEEPEGDGWPHWAKIIFVNERLAFTFSSWAEIDKNSFIGTFKILK